jgi:hypothetical protein
MFLRIWPLALLFACQTIDGVSRSISRDELEEVDRKCVENVLETDPDVEFVEERFADFDIICLLGPCTKRAWTEIYKIKSNTEARFANVSVAQTSNGKFLVTNSSMVREAGCTHLRYPKVDKINSEKIIMRLNDHIRSKCVK